MNFFVSRRLSWLFAVAVLGLAQGCKPALPPVIKIGVAQPLTGNLASLGQDMLNGVKLAADEINAHGFVVDGHPVTLEVVAVDDQADAEIGKAVARKLVDQGVVAVIGHLNSGVSIAAAPIYAERHIAQLAISTHPRYTALGYATTFRLVANDNLQSRAMGKYAAENFNSTRFAVLDDGTPYGKNLAAGATDQLRAAQKEIVVQQSFDDKTRDFDAVAARLKAAKVESVVTTLGDFQVAALLEALQKVNYNQMRILGGDTLKSPLLLKNPNVPPGKLFATSGILEPADFRNSKVFVDTYRAKYRQDVAYAAHYTYDAMQQLAVAIRTARSSDPERIAAALRQVDSYVPVTGYMKWDLAGEQTYGAVAVYKIRDSRWESQVRSDRW